MTRRLLMSALLASLPLASPLHAQSVSKKHILVDIAHGPRFWSDPASMTGRAQNEIDRARYMTAQLRGAADSLGAELEYVAQELTAGLLSRCDALFIHLPTKPYSASEIKALDAYVNRGGSLLVVMEEDYWSKLEDTNVNEILNRFGVTFGGLMPGQHSGGYTKAGLVTPQALKIPYHGGRLVSGGTPFCFTKGTEEQAFGVFVDLRKGGRVIAMGDGMVSLYMTSWQGVNGYQCGEFMRGAFAWLLE